MPHALSVSTPSPSPPRERQARIEYLVSEATAVLLADPAAARALLVQAMILLRDPHGLLPNDDAADAIRGGLATWQARWTARHIELHLDQTISVADLAALVRLSRTHFSCAFRRTFGTSPHTYVLERRIARAKQLMLETDMPLSEIACACGMCDQAHLSRLFRRFEGSSPLLWRRARLERPPPAAQPADGRPDRLAA